MHAILDLHVTGLHEADVGLVDQSAGIEQRMATAGTESRPGQPSQIGVRRGIQRVGRRAIAILRPINQLRQRGRSRWWGLGTLHHELVVFGEDDSLQSDYSSAKRRPSQSEEAS
jgi:hypothetical protein